MRRTTISNFSFKRSFQTESKGGTPYWLTQKGSGYASYD